MAESPVLSVRLYDREIGTLTRLGGDRNLFAFNDAYISDPGRPTLSLSFKDVFGNLIIDPPITQTRVLPFFANLLPEGHLREYLAAHAGVKTQRDVPLLAALGADLPGAVRVIAAENVSDDEGGETRPAEPQSGWHFSLAGVQLKFSVVRDAKGGLTIPVGGTGGHWILKLPSGTYAGVPENEFAMMRLARSVGIDTPEVALVSLDQVDGLPEDVARLTGQALAVERFDRTGDERIHIEDFAQVFGVYPDRKYEKASYRNIAEVIWAETGEAGVVEFLRRLVFSMLIGNADMHLKNISLIYPDRYQAALAPAYDLVPTIAFLADDKFALKFYRSKCWRDVNAAALKAFVRKARLPEKPILEAARETVQRFRLQWAAGEMKDLVATEARAAVDRHLAELPLADELG